MGLVNMLEQLGHHSKVFYQGIPFLMRLLPLTEKPKRWHNNLHFRIRNKLINYFNDKKLLKEISTFDCVIISECYCNGFWKNYFALEELKKRYKGKIISYTEGPIDSAPLNKKRHFDEDDHDEKIYDYNLFVTDVIETKTQINSETQAVVGVDLTPSGLKPKPKKEFIAIVDFAQNRYEEYRSQQIKMLEKLGIDTIILERRYAIEEIRALYQKASVFFMAFPETFGLPIAECLAAGTYIFTPNSGWPMAWRLDEKPIPGGVGKLPACFEVYDTDEDLAAKLLALKRNYNSDKTPIYVFDTFIKHYSKFYYGDTEALRMLLNKILTT